MVLTLIIGIIKTFLGYASKRNDNATATALEGLRADVELSREQAEITRAKIGHPVAWIPAFVIECSVAVYISVQIMDAVFDLAGDVQPVSLELAGIVSAVVAGMTVKATWGRK
jgi:hypothetical protein